MAKSNSSRKFIIASASTALVAAAVAPAVGAASQFSDVKADSIYAQPVEALVNAGVINGFPDGKFHTGASVTRAEASKMISVIRGLDTKNAPATPFSDVKEGAWYAEYINALYNAELIDGLPGGTFGPNETLTRAQFAKMVVEAYGLEIEDTNLPFNDVKEGAWYTPYIKTLYKNGLIKGVTAATFAPNNNIKRGDFALLLNDTNVKFGQEATISEIAAIDDITIDEGTEAVLPKTVKAKMSDDTTKEVAVKWDTTKLDTNKPGTYTVTGEVEGTELTASVKVIVKEVAPVVVGVEAVNATQVEVKFNKAVDPKSVFADGKSGAFKATVSFTSLEKPAVASGTLSGKLSEDGKTLTVTAQNPLSKRYDVVVDGIKTVDNKAVAKYEEMITIAADEKAPTILGTEQISANKVKINFSEPVKAHTTATLKYADGETVNGASVTVAAGATSVIVDLSANTVDVNKAITVTFIGLQDQAGNLITPNPATVTITKQQVDGVKPTVASVTQTGAKTFNVKFTKDLAGAPSVTVSNYVVDSIKKVSDSEYEVTVQTNLKGVQNVVVAAGYTDLADQAGEAVTKVVTFAEDAVAPKATSVKTVTVDGVEYLELTFDKEVTEGNITVSGSYTKDYVTVPVASKTVAVTYASASDKKVVRTPLSGFATAEGGAYKVDVTSATVGSLSGVAFEKTAATFTRGKDVAANTTKLAAPAITQTSNDTVTVTFTGEVDGASATDISNYTVDGAVIEKAELEAYGKTAKGKQVVTLTLKEDSNAFTGNRNITVQNVKALGSSVTMDKFTVNTVSLTENVRPTVTKAVLTANNEITLTFSEAVSNVNDTAGKDFDLFIGGTKAADLALTAETVATSSEKNTLVLTITGGQLSAADLANGLSVKPATTINVVDSVSNALNFESINVAQ